MKIELVEEVPSTNEYIRRYLSGGENVVVCAKRQSAGKGTKGRTFLSEEGGVYLSALTFYQDLPSREAFRVMMHAAVAVCKTLEVYGCSPEIKWPNDVLVNGRKACGILIENILEGDKLKASVVGIGLNVQNDVSALNGIAFSLNEVVPDISVEEVRNTLLQNLNKQTSFSAYQQYVRLGKVTVEENGESYDALALGVLEDGRLKIQVDGRERTLSSAEIRRIS